MMVWRRHLTTTTHQMAAVPNMFTYGTRARLGSSGCERCDETSEQDERYEFTHGSVLN
jgi:hypothetical protein